MPIHPKQPIVYRFPLLWMLGGLQNLTAELRSHLRPNASTKPQRMERTFTWIGCWREPETETYLKRNAKLKCIARFEIFEGARRLRVKIVSVAQRRTNSHVLVVGYCAVIVKRAG